MSQDKVRVAAYVTVEVEVSVGSWSGEAQCKQLHGQATCEAVQQMERLCAKERGVRVLRATSSRVQTWEDKE